ncbi:SAYSvFN domain-containing protein 1 [Macrotis lagotis]|uniref:SAYSvFN domain-containing protein 1 n=1 Tax=Macrotis lagotis TaxID=92651 RepID=UPI003D683E0C
MEQRLAAFRASRRRAELQGGAKSAERSGKTTGEDVAAAPTPPPAQGAPGRRAEVRPEELSSPPPTLTVEEAPPSSHVTSKAPPLWGWLHLPAL